MTDRLHELVGGQRQLDLGESSNVGDVGDVDGLDGRTAGSLPDREHPVVRQDAVRRGPGTDGRHLPPLYLQAVQGRSVRQGREGAHPRPDQGRRHRGRDVKLLHNATKNVQANPTLCATLAKPIGQLADQLSALSSQVTSGNLAGITSVEPLVSGLMSAATSAGIPVKETTDTTGS